jgi:glycosyltransferase involved in cell wall biosynthesis
VTRPLRVAIVARSVFPLHGLGGLERSVYDLTRYLAAHNVHATLITRTPSKDHADDAVASGITTRFVPYRTFPLAGRRGTTVLDRSTAYPLFGERAGKLAWQLVGEGLIDVVHGFGASVLGYARRRARSAAPLVLNPQGLEEFGATDPSRARLKRAAYLPLRRAVIACARAADCVIATDRALEPAVLAHLKVPRDRIRTIPNALDLSIVDRLAGPADRLRMRHSAGIRDDELVLLSVGRIERNKGFHVLADALAALAEHSAPIAEGRWRWIIAGDGPFRAGLERAVRDRRLSRRVMFAGRLPDAALHAWYEASDLFVHPTLYEGSSLATLEAMSHRRAVVATIAGGLPDKVRAGVNGWLVPPGDASALAAAISGALGDPARLASMGEAGRAIVEREFSWDAAGAATLQLYEDLLR